jgi:hypothetical protein
MKYIKLDDLDAGTNTPQVISIKPRTKEFKLTLQCIKLCALSKHSREIVFTNDFKLKPNRFEDMAENVLKEVRRLGYKYSLYDWKENRLTYLATPEGYRNSVIDKSQKGVVSIPSTVLNEFDITDVIPI